SYRQSTGVLPTDRQFQGQQNQASVGLYHMGARWYDPTIGLWTQPDTVVPNPMDPLALNRYSFVEGNPLKYTDPTGHKESVADVMPMPWSGGSLGPGLAGAAAALAVSIGQKRQEIASSVDNLVGQAQVVVGQVEDDLDTVYIGPSQRL